MAEEVQIDQEVYDRLIAAGTSERIARAKAKAASVRKAKIAEGANLGPRPAEQATKALEEFRSSHGGGGTAVATKAGADEAGNGGGRLTPEERSARVAASLGGNGNTSIGVPTSSQHTHRLLALVPPAGIQQVQSKQMDKVYTWPHLLLVEFVALLAMGSLLLIVSFFLDAPLGSLANPNQVPAINKAPWYFMGLQELLRYFHPMVAGVTLPGVAVVMLMAIPYLDKNPSARPENRKVANMAFTFFLTFWTVLVIIGSFLRGAGYEWVWPWTQGLGFTL
ncbi:menaquinol-cytochrome c reductase cytochrome b subunit [Egicoccus sp. AB-alg6-2]|uniref:menaquinol-cytochrome c reductase cytochrome b subunit n=1 Tax=Egicoccus sp. AB-alg6-2 TaxID=3242692 RepID=UPI00359D6F30